MQNKCFLWSCLWILNRSTLFHAYPSHDVACNNSSKSLGSDAYYQKVERTHPWIHYLCIKNFNVIDWKCFRNHLWFYNQFVIHHLFYLKGWIKVWQFCTFEIDIRQWRPRPRYGKQHHKYEKRPCQRPLRYYVK